MAYPAHLPDVRHLSDHDLIAQTVLGASAAFGELVRRHAPALRTHLRRMGAQGADADDMAQEAFIAAYESLSDYRADASAEPGRDGAP
ncbi:MAG: sigma factor, partial [Asticcacaulis sp.]